MTYGAIVNKFYLILPEYSTEPYKSNQQYSSNEEALNALKADYPNVIVVSDFEIAKKSVERSK